MPAPLGDITAQKTLKDARVLTVINSSFQPHRVTMPSASGPAASGVASRPRRPLPPDPPGKGLRPRFAEVLGVEPERHAQFKAWSRSVPDEPQEQVDAD